MIARQRVMDPSKNYREEKRDRWGGSLISTEPTVYICGLADIQDPNDLKKRNIEAILDINIGIYGYPYSPPSWIKEQSVNYLNIPLEDSSDIDLEPILYDALRFIVENALIKKKGIIVNCMMGISRSVSIVTAFYMWFYKENFDEALARVRNGRPIANPNLGFVLTLEHIMKKIHAYTFDGYTRS